ncbi:MAG: extracellular solute-binding protein [Verrucomicrobiales bacterium]|nr:extracellular solute-binding protein [Verrucomicrobiales bacterium]MBP9224179.1 extracellular solute-binding protein [Verrucomicrobiales bacterium]
MVLRLSIVLAVLATVLAAPFLFRPDGPKNRVSAHDAERLVIITPHNESIQAEFARAFTRHMKEKYGRSVFVDWRQPGGTSEIARFLRSEFALRFENEWGEKTNLPFDSAIREAFSNPRQTPTPTQQNQEGHNQEGQVNDPTLFNTETLEARAALARRLFLDSTAGVGIDLFFGGGAYDFERQAGAGVLVSTDHSGRYGLGALAREHPDWFSDAVMPESVSGEPFRDPEFRWAGTVLSAFGICYNSDSFARLGIPGIPDTWSALEDPRLFGQIALADPTKSGSTTKAFEMLVQERIQTLQRERHLPEAAALRAGWDDAMRLIVRISANSRYFTDAAAKVPRDVAMGDAAAGMCIDFYGRTFNEIYRSPETGKSRIHFVMPRNGTSIGADPIGMLRGAPNPELAHRFLEFILSTEGQKLWNYRVGAEGGPKRFALRRPPIRRDFYTAANQPFMTDPEVDPYKLSADFTYHPEWTGPLFGALRFVIRAACMDAHEEQVAAWRALREAGLPPEGLARFEDISEISFDTVTAEIVPGLKDGDKVKQVAMGRILSESFREKYREIAEAYGGNR